ncbi:MAG: hypothetical protein ACE5HX_01455 [bacterium]
MEKQNLVIDFGGTATKAIWHAGRKIIRKYCFESEQYACSQAGIQRLLSDLKLEPGTLSTLVVTGGQSQQIPHAWPELKIICIDEIEAIGTGGLLAIGASEALVVSMGTGTAIVVARFEKINGKKFHIQHVGGLGLGGGTILGLGKLLCGAQSFNDLDSLAVEGHTEKVDLLVGDIVGRDIGIIPAELTASNFGRVARKDITYSKADIAAGLFTLVGQSVARLAIVLAKQRQIEPIVVIGQVIENAYMQRVFKSMQKIFGGHFIFTPEARYRVAEGAFALALDKLITI